MANEKRTDLISRKALIAEYDRVHIGTPGGARKLMEDAPAVDAVEVVHAYWTGLIPSDYTYAEGFSTEMTQEEKAKRHEDFMHTTHCSNCRGGFDDRWIRYWKYCPECGAKMINT